jgi:elongation of very long chain fatty acids protein 7
MENRKPFKLRNLLIVYNFAQVLFSLFLFYEASISGWLTGYSLRCESVDYSNSPKALRVNIITSIITLRLFVILSIFSRFVQMAAGCWWYFFSKFTEFFDTFFFVMRKRYDQVSTLHVIHHGIMPFSGKCRSRKLKVF